MSNAVVITTLGQEYAQNDRCAAYMAALALVHIHNFRGLYCFTGLVYIRGVHIRLL
jgi:hypothetical protein